jgi:RND family efflux transporter MFP subunit
VKLLRFLLLAPALGFPLTASADAFECLIEPVQVVEIRSPVEGLIDKMYVQRGDFIKTGQVLVELESAAERSAAESAKYRAQMEGKIALSRNRFEYASKKYQRMQELQKQNFVPAQQRDDAEAEMRIAESDLRDAVENQELAKIEYKRAVDLLNLRILRSPFNGVVVDRMLNPGDLAESGTGRKPMLKIAQIDPLRVEVVLPLDAFGKLRVGMTGQIKPEGLGGSHPASVKVVDRVFDAASGTFGVRLELPNRNGALPGGIRCQVDFPNLKNVSGKPLPPKPKPISYPGPGAR